MGRLALTSTRVRILALTPRPLHPANTGGRIRSLRLFERLARQHELTLVCLRAPTDPPESFEQLRACCSRLEIIDWRDRPRQGPRFYAGLVRSLADPLPYTVRTYESAAATRHLAALLDTGQHDLLLCDFLQPSINCLDLAFRPKVLFQHNVETMIRRGLAAQATNPAARAFFHQDAMKLERYERRAAAAFDHCIMVSEEDCRTMARVHGVERTSAIPSAVDTSYFQPAATHDGRQSGILFIGSMDMLANQDAVRYFTRAILPKIRAVEPAAFTIVGRNPSGALRALARATPDTMVTGTVDDVRPWMAAARVVVVPLRIGGGTRLRIFEALAMGQAVVSTRLGAEGLPVTDGTNICLEDSPSAFAAAVVRLLRSPGECRRLGNAGRRLVEHGFGWDAAAARFSGICEAVVAGETGGPEPVRPGP